MRTRERSNYKNQKDAENAAAVNPKIMSLSIQQFEEMGRLSGLSLTKKRGSDRRN